MSIADQQFDECLTDAIDFFGRSLTRRPLGIAANDETVVGIWVETTSQLDNDTGVANERKGILKLVSAQEVEGDDLFVIDGEAWAVESQGMAGGLRELKLTTTAHARVRTTEGI